MNKDCPFCGMDAIEEGSIIFCSNCGATASKNMWNERANAAVGEHITGGQAVALLKEYQEYNSKMDNDWWDSEFLEKVNAFLSKQPQ